MYQEETRGRPPKDPDKRRDIRQQTYLTEEHKKLLEQYAEENDWSASQAAESIIRKFLDKRRSELEVAESIVRASSN